MAHRVSSSLFVALFATAAVPPAMASPPKYLVHLQVYEVGPKGQRELVAEGEVAQSPRQPLARWIHPQRGFQVDVRWPKSKTATPESHTGSGDQIQAAILPESASPTPRPPEAPLRSPKPAPTPTSTLPADQTGPKPPEPKWRKLREMSRRLSDIGHAKVTDDQPLTQTE